jgi:hypothetical protein
VSVSTPITRSSIALKSILPDTTTAPCCCVLNYGNRPLEADQDAAADRLTNRGASTRPSVVLMAVDCGPCLREQPDLLLELVERVFVEVLIPINTPGVQYGGTLSVSMWYVVDMCVNVGCHVTDM